MHAEEAENSRSFISAIQIKAGKLKDHADLRNAKNPPTRGLVQVMT